MKNLVKTILRKIAILLVSPLILACRLAGSKKLFVSCGQLLSLIPGTLGSYFRVAFYRHTLDSCSQNIHIDFGSFFAHREAWVGKGVYIGAYCVIGMVRLGEHATIGSGVHILSGKHQHSFGEIGKPIQEQNGQFTQLCIGENSWIGNGAIIMADIGRQNVIGAGSVVVKPSGDLQILAGNPARMLASLDRSNE